MKKNSFLEGTIIASLAIIIVKILGALYVIPFYSIIGEKGGTLYSYAYNVYNLFLNITTAGIPIAISKIISEYNTMGMNKTKERAYSIGKKMIFIISAVTFFALFVFSKEVAYIFIGNLKGGTNIDDISLVLKSVSFCLLVVPYLSMLRGYLQGHKYIDSSSKSQVIEQVVRIAVVLMGAYISINILNSKVSIGVAIAVLGAFIGAIAAWVYLKIKIKQNKDLFKKEDDPSIKQEEVTNKEIIKKIIKYCIPFIIVSISVNIYSVTDQALVIRGLTHIGYSTTNAEVIASIISTWGIKICMIINAIATGISISLMPHMTAGRVSNNREEINHKFNQALSVIFAVALPLTIIISILSTGVYTLFYGESLYGGIILQFLVFTAFFSSLDIVIDVALQGLNKFKIIYTCTLTGFITNAALDLPLIYLFNKIGIYPYYGAIAATIIGYILSLSISLISVKKEEKLNFSPLIKNIKKLILPILAMSIFLYFTNKFIPINELGGIKLLTFLGIDSILSATVFIIILSKNDGLNTIFGKHNIDNIILKFKKIFKRKSA